MELELLQWYNCQTDFSFIFLSGGVLIGNHGVQHILNIESGKNCAERGSGRELKGMTRLTLWKYHIFLVRSHSLHHFVNAKTVFVGNLSLLSVDSAVKILIMRKKHDF